MVAIILRCNKYNNLFFFELGIMLPHGFKGREKNSKQIKRNISSSKYPILSYAMTPGISSCQTKMVLGHPCGGDVALHQSDIIEAIRRIRQDFKFVGLTEEPNASARLYLAMYVDEVIANNNTIDIDYLLNRSNRKNTKISNATINSLTDVLKEQKWSDRYDEQLYEAAARIFYERCAVYSIVTEYVFIK